MPVIDHDEAAFVKHLARKDHYAAVHRAHRRAVFGAEIQPLMDALNFVIERAARAEFASRSAIDRGLEVTRPQPVRSDVRESLFLQSLVFLDSRHRLGVRCRVLAGDADGRGVLTRQFDPAGMDVGESPPARRYCFECEPVSAGARINAYPRQPIPGPIPLVKIEGDAAPLPFAVERSQRSSRFDAEQAGRAVDDYFRLRTDNQRGSLRGFLFDR